MNSLGRIFRFHIFGESHGKAIGAVIDGCPAGLSLSEDDFTADLNRRRSGARGTTARHEVDRPYIMSGVLEGKTTGAPVLIQFENGDVDSSSYLKHQHLPRPGHADLVARQKFGGFHDWRGGGHFSARLTAAVVAGGVIAKKLLTGIDIAARVTELGGMQDLDRAIEAAEQAKDSIGGIVECRVDNIPPGLGEPFFDSLESVLAHVAFSIPGVKAIEFGAGLAVAQMRGSEYADAIVSAGGKTATNHSGGINGGISNGNPIIFRVAMRPASGSAKQLQTIHLNTGANQTIVPQGRHDRCIPLRMPVILEAMTAMVLVDFMLLEQRIGKLAKS